MDTRPTTIKILVTRKNIASLLKSVCAIVDHHHGKAYSISIQPHNWMPNLVGVSIDQIPRFMDNVSTTQRNTVGSTIDAISSVVGTAKMKADENSLNFGIRKDHDRAPEYLPLNQKERASPCDY
jgi:hypothetical protein